MLKFGFNTNSNMQNSMEVFTFFRWETPFWRKFCSENQNCQSKLKFGT